MEQKGTKDLMLCSIADFIDVTTDELLGRTSNRKKAIIADVGRTLQT